LSSTTELWYRDTNIPKKEYAMNDDQQKEERPAQGHEPHREHQHFEIQIDRHHYTVTLHEMTGLQLRHLPKPPIGPNRDLFEVVPGGSDKKISDDQEVKMRNGLRFFTAPAQINPGIGNPVQEHFVVTI
jgi:hypothetical protein